MLRRYNTSPKPPENLEVTPRREPLLGSRAMALSIARRRPSATAEPPRDEGYSKEEKPQRSSEEGNGGKEGLHWLLPLMALGVMRYMSATSNILHDCDEVFNYWEPLHYILYKSGFQTWEYSSEFALRSYLYIFFHAFVAAPASWLFNEDKVRVFYSVRMFLGFISAITETVLVVAISRKYGKRLASYLLAMLCLTSGCQFASTSFLPSSFSMYSITLSSAFFLLEKYSAAVSVAAIGVLLGWPFSFLAVLPLTFYCLIKGRFRTVFISGLATSVLLLTVSTIVDYYTYGRWTSSVLNLLLYNVWGGGESHLYGTEGALFYFRNGFNNFNIAFILALLFLAVLPFARQKCNTDIYIVIAPMYIWLVFMSLQPHKEERFLYPIYTLICVAAAATLDSFPDLFHDKYRSGESVSLAAKIFRSLVFGLILCTSHSRTFSVLNGYSAPMNVYKHLEEHHEDIGADPVVCIGSEWHRFPSSFFIPPFISEVRWVDDGFRGLLPFPFNSTLGGTASAPPYFNNKNKASDEQYLRDLEHCSFFVELDLKRQLPAHGSDLSTWEILAAVPFLDREQSPSLYRSFFIPHMWNQRNVFGLYKLLKRIPIDNPSEYI